jgi:hypothetical protein
MLCTDEQLDIVGHMASNSLSTVNDLMRFVVDADTRAIRMDFWSYIKQRRNASERNDERTNPD